MTFKAALIATLPAALTFFAAFVAIGVAMDVFVYAEPIQWVRRLASAVVGAGVFLFLSPMMRKDQNQ